MASPLSTIDSVTLNRRKATHDAWGRYVADLVRPAGNNVIEMRSKA